MDGNDGFLLQKKVAGIKKVPSSQNEVDILSYLRKLEPKKIVSLSEICHMFCSSSRLRDLIRITSSSPRYVRAPR